MMFKILHISHLSCFNFKALGSVSLEHSISVTKKSTIKVWIQNKTSLDVIYFYSQKLNCSSSSGLCGCGLITSNWQSPGNISKQPYNCHYNLNHINSDCCIEVCDIAFFKQASTYFKSVRRAQVKQKDGYLLLIFKFWQKYFFCSWRQLLVIVRS